jgi:hypothetical protein
MYVPIQSFAPDLDPFTPGIITDCRRIMPTIRGVKPAPASVDLGIDALAAATTGVAQVRLLSGANRLFAGTTTKLYELSGTSWTDRTRTVGGDYTGSSSNRWRFAQFGNVTLAVNQTDILQSSSSGAFADVAGAPDAKIVETVGLFVFLFATNEGTFGDSPDRWWCSAIGDYTDWTPAISTQCATGRIVSIPGAIQAGRRLGERIVIYKDRGISVGSYTGPAFIWSFSDIPTDVGAISQETVVSIETAHLFMSRDGFFAFDGVNVSPIDQDIRNWWVNRVNQTNIAKSWALHNRREATVTWYYPTTGTAVDEGLIYNYRSGKWGLDDHTVEAVVEYVPSGLSWDNLGNSYSTWDSLPNLSWDSAFPNPGGDIPAIMNTSHELFSLTAAPGSWSITTGDIGDDQKFSFLERVIPRFITTPNSANLTNYYRNATTVTRTQDATTTMSSGRFDVYRSARWHSGVLAGTGDMELAGFQYIVSQDGDE